LAEKVATLTSVFVVTCRITVAKCPQVTLKFGTLLKLIRNLIVLIYSAGSVLGYSNSCRAPKNPTPDETDNMAKLVSEYWYSVDLLHEEVCILLRVVHETRDIIRGCYVYTGTFYKWELPTYDAFLTNVDTIKRQGGSQTLTTIKEAWDKYLVKDGTDARKLADSMAILLMMDFSTSAYQTILQSRTIECDGIFMKLV